MLSKLLTVLTAPRKTMESLSDRPAWWIALVAIALLVSLSAALTSHISGPEQMEMMKQSRFGERFAHTPEYQAKIDEAAHPTIAGRIRTSIVGSISVLIGLVVGGLLWHVVCRVAGGVGSLKQTFAIVMLGDWIAVGLNSILKAPLILAKGQDSMTVTFSLAALLPEKDPTASTFRLLTTFTDLFALWALVVTVIGFQVVHRFGKGKAWGVGLIPWLVYMGLLYGLGSLFI
jgi:hypothetical protein